MEYFSTEKQSQSKSTIVNRQEGNDSQIKHHWRMAQKIYATVTEYSWEGVGEGMSGNTVQKRCKNK